MGDARALLTLAVPSYNRRAELERCLRSVAREAPGLPVLVIDDGSSDGTAQMIAERYPWAACIRLEKNCGPAAARNRALESVETPYVAFFDSDVEMKRGWYETVLAALDPFTVLACRVDRPDGTMEWGPRRTRFWGGSTSCGPEEADAGSSNNLIAPVELARAIGGFSEELSFYFEDTFFCICVRDAGGRVRYVDGAAVTHYHDSRPSLDRIRRFSRNRAFAMVRLSRHPRLMSAVQILLGILTGAGALARLHGGAAWVGLRGTLRGIADASD